MMNGLMDLYLQILPSSCKSCCRQDYPRMSAVTQEVLLSTRLRSGRQNKLQKSVGYGYLCCRCLRCNLPDRAKWQASMASVAKHKWGGLDLYGQRWNQGPRHTLESINSFRREIYHMFSQSENRNCPPPHLIGAPLHLVRLLRYYQI